MENWKVELTRRGNSPAEIKIQRRIFQGDSLSLELFVMAMILLNYILRKCKGSYKLIESQKRINHLTYMNDIKIFA